jgi:hypothetical protein
MVNVNTLYELCLSVEIEKCIKPHLINDEMLITVAMRLLYQNEQLRDSILLEGEM